MTQPQPFNLPPWMMTSEPGSFAYYTMTERIPRIIQQVIASNSYPAWIVDNLQHLINELLHEPVRLVPLAKHDKALWERELAHYSGRTWLNLPWFFAESYLYRRIVEATGFYTPGPTFHLDPFHPQKRQALEAEIQNLAPEVEAFETLLASQGTLTPAMIQDLLHMALWGNRADLSMFNIREKAVRGQVQVDQAHLIVVDQSEQASEYLAQGLHRIDFLNDNSGAELFFDLFTADCLLTYGGAQQITFRLKDHSYFVSDAMPVDVFETVDFIEQRAEPVLHRFGRRLKDHIDSGKLALTENPYWTNFSMFTAMPPTIRGELSQAQLIVIKGDANYRRLVEDRHWPFDTPLESVTAYFPVPFLSLRTLKSEVLVGLGSGVAEELEASEPGWMINGKRGVIQFGRP